MLLYSLYFGTVPYFLYWSSDYEMAGPPWMTASALSLGKLLADAGHYILYIDANNRRVPWNKTPENYMYNTSYSDSGFVYQQPEMTYL